MDPLTRLQAGVDQARPVVAATTPDQYGNATPCENWTVHELLNHMLAALTMFRDVGVDGAADPALFSRDLVGADAAAAFNEVSAAAVAAWSKPGKVDEMAKLPFGEFPAQFALQLPAMDMVVHAWDLAKATGQQVDWNADLVDDTYEFCTATFSSAEFRGDDFQPPVPAPAGADTLTELVCFLGRNP